MSFLTANNSLARIKFGDPDATNAGIIIYSHADDSFRFQHTTNERLRITSAGKVGIGEDTPLGTLHVKEGDSGVSSADAEQDTLFLENNGNAGLTIATPNANTGYLTFADPEDSNVGQIIYRHGGTNANSMGFFVNTAERLRIDSDGDLIHTATNKTLSLVTTANVSNAGTKIAFFGADRYETNEEFASIRGLLTSNSGGAGNKQNGGLQFVIGSDSHTHAMTQAGYFGIGTGVPQTKLHVETTTGTATYATISQQKQYGVGTGTAERAGLNLAIRESSVTANNRYFGRIEVGTESETTSANGFMSFFTRNGGNINEKLRITSGGAVGINSTSPAATLDIHDIGSNGPCLLLRGGSSTEGDIVVPHDEALAFGHWNYSSNTFTERLRIDSAGDVFPGADNGQDLGTSSKRWANVYSADLQLSNKGKTNNVDGTWGDFTIQEGESDLFLINNRSGKKYKFNLTEVT